MVQGIIPHYKLLICYDMKEGMQEAYYQFVLGELAPAMQSIGLYMLQVYHTAYGKYPVRQLEFVAEDLETIRNAMKSEIWRHVQGRFQALTCNYTQKIVRFREGFQF
jgi:hypothetical protein